MKITALIIVFVLAIFATPAEAKKGNHHKNNKRNIELAKKREAEEQKEREERKKIQDKIDGVLDKRDRNNDGSLTKDEFLSGESNKEAGLSKFEEFDKNNDRNLTKTEIQKMLGL